ncbi:MAG: ABC transporter permease [Bacteroidales bacterium]|nr:ABC transporter permease [Bacteroidales bacterium]MCB9000022.1 ABC transporter permease [Bacteroidales bacterium]MCB9013248.1 ABC transporter permease [Bacteroidales bacterium]
MLRGIRDRLLYGIAVMLGVITLIFFLFNVLPGDPARMMLGQRADMASLESIRKELGLDRPLYLQYIRYINDLSPLSVYQLKNKGSYFYLDPSRSKALPVFTAHGGSALVLKKPWLGRSFQSRRPVGDMISEAFPNTMILALTAILIAFFIGTFLGTFSALHKDSWYDRISILVSAFGMSVPSFFAAILMAWLFAYKLGDITHLNITGNLYEIDDFGRGIHLSLKNLILPAITLGIRPLSVVVQLSRNSMLEVLNEDYIRTAYAKGLRKSRIIIVHALRNSLNPVITAISGWFASMLAGVVFIEYIFGWRGLGYMLVNALNFYDLPVVLGCVLTTSIIFVTVNISMDVLYAFLDPRIRK